MPKLTVQNAEIKTATVEVRTLTLSGKQVTLSVFRQIEKADILNPDGSLRGEAWGRVNYCIDGCKDSRHKHAHVVWQDGTDLRRSIVQVNPWFDNFSSPTGDAWLTSAILDYLNGDTSLFPDDSKVPVDKHCGTTGQAYEDLSISGVRFQVDGANSVVAAWNARPAASWEWRSGRGLSAEESDRWEKARKDLEATVSAYEATTAQLWNRLQDDVATEIRRRAAVRSMCLQLNELPQLFIAV